MASARPRIPSISLAAVLCCVVLAGGGARADHTSVAIGLATAGPINTEPGATLPAGRWAVSGRTEYVSFEEFSDGELARLRAQDPTADLHSVASILSTSVAIFYGVTDDLTIGARVPYIWRDRIREPGHADDHEQRTPVAAGHGLADEGDHGADGGGGGPSPHVADPGLVENLGDVDGVGDATFLVQYRFFHRPSAHDASAIVGLKTPTGQTRETARQGFRLETELQPGTGSWDPLLGLSYTYTLAPFALGTNVLYTFATKGAQQTDMGDIFDYNAAISYRIGAGGPHAEAPGGQEAVGPRPVLDLVLELNGEWRDTLDVDGITNDNSGGNILYLSPGMRLGLFDRLGLGVSFGVPVVTDLNGDQVEPEYRIVSNVGFTF